jgi:hypothetical protein
MKEPRRLTPPWRVVEHEGSFVVQDANGLPLGYVYFEDDFKRNWAIIGGRLTKDEARRVANGFARLPELILKERAANSQLPDIPED